MTNLFIAITLFILLVTQKILLLNEESLILLCFIIFVNLGMNKFGNILKESFKIQSNEVEVSLKNSLKQLLIVIQDFTSLSSSSTLFLKKVKAVKNYYKTLVSLLSNYILVHNKYYLTQFYAKKLTLLDKAENQTIKLLTIIIIKQLNLIVKTKSFYMNYVKLNQLLCFTNISIRECIELIKIKKN